MAKGKPTITKPAQKPKPPPQAKPAEEKTLADCRRARHDYFILETLTAGMVLQGWEVKSARAGRAQINESYVIVSRAGFVIVGLPFAILLFYAFLACRVFGSEMTILARVCRQRFVYLYAVAFGYRGSGWFLASPDSGGCCFGCARRFDGIVYCRAVWQHQGFAPIIAVFARAYDFHAYLFFAV